MEDKAKKKEKNQYWESTKSKAGLQKKNYLKFI